MSLDLTPFEVVLFIIVVGAVCLGLYAAWRGSRGHAHRVIQPTAVVWPRGGGLVEAMTIPTRVQEQTMRDLRVAMTSTPLDSSAARSAVAALERVATQHRGERVVDRQEVNRVEEALRDNPRIDRSRLIEVLGDYPGHRLQGVDRDIRTLQYILWLRNANAQLEVTVPCEELEHVRAPLGPAPAWVAEPEPAKMPIRSGRLWRVELKKQTPPAVDIQKATPTPAKRRSRILKRGSPR
jgi:hypothetical protein